MELHPFALEHLEDRALFCAIAPTDTAPTTTAPAVRAAPLVTATVKNPFPAAFNVAGKFTHPFGNPDAGSQYIFTGSGKTAALGKFTLTGHLQTPGLIANGKASGRLILTTSKGVITLSLHGPPQNPGSLPPTVSYYLVKGTGPYAGNVAKGTIGISASATTQKFLFRFHPKV